MPPTSPSIVPADRESTTTWEPFKIAIAAFYAICVQKALDTTIAVFHTHPPSVVVDGKVQPQALDHQQIVVLLQLAAFLLWLGLYYIGNVMLYFRDTKGRSVRRVATHTVLSLGLVSFYFLGATLGSPSTNQLLIMLVVVMLDAAFPITLGDSISTSDRYFWVLRGLVQSAFVGYLVLAIPSQELDAVWWSAAWLALMLIQLLVVVPLERLWAGRKSPPQSP